MIKRYVIAHDLHHPRVNEKTWGCMLRVIEELKPDGFVFGGDQFDNAEISHHNKDKSYYKERRSYLRNEESFIQQRLLPLKKSLPKKAELIWIIGNHDFWEFQFIEEHPEFEGVIDRVKSLKLIENGWEVIPLGHSKKLGHLNVIHGEVLTGIGNQCGIFPAKKAVELYSANVLAGHTHSPQSFAKISPVEQKKKYMSWIAPILADCNPDYLRNRPTAWLNGFTIVELHENGRDFNLYPIICIDGRCSYGGKEYVG